VTDTLPRLEGPGDAELISAVRGGDVSAYGPLFERHVEAARRLARQLVGAADADDLVSDAFAKVLRVLQNGGGPDVAFRAYLLTAVRRLHVDKIRANSKLHTTDNLEMFDPGVPFRDTAVEGFESAAAAKAFASLPERWQAVLWHTEVEGQKPAEVAEILGMTPNSVSALAYRAREGLRQAFLNSHAMDVEDDACGWTHQHLGGYIREGISKRDAGKVEKHIDECRKCMAIYLELSEVNSNLAGILAPLLLGSAGIGYLASAGAATKGAFLLFLDRAKDTMASNGPATATAGVVVAGVVAVSAVVALQSGGQKATPPRADVSRPGVTASATPPSDAPPSDAPPVVAPLTPPVDTTTGAGATVVATPAPTTAPTTASTTRPTTATPTPTPSSTPTPLQADVAFASAPTATATSAGTYQVAVAVTGIPAGQSVSVQTSSSPAGSPRLAPRRLLASTGGGVVVDCPNNCLLTSASPSLVLMATVTGDQAQNLTITLVPSAGFTDPDASDNTTTLRLEPAAPEPVVYDASITRGDVSLSPGGSGKYDITFNVADLAPGGRATVTLTGTDLTVEAVTGGETTCAGDVCSITDTGDGATQLVVRVRTDRTLLAAPRLDAVLGGFDFNEAGGTNNTAGWYPLLNLAGTIIL
jgi:RNA polymerase sigma factor (sigma-70 family)